ncbi:adenylate/guanylate cyclase domain-containing protein [Roseiflexus sp.]|uniref:adenylate/guanylate cyclase domain-containing protein n=1 Tax=Roseiflexus sp. TaxID=2562120 RepID=UPI00398A648D
MTSTLSSPLESRITGSFSTRFLLELFGNSIHFPVANVLFELLVEEPLDYLRRPDLYVIFTASLIQTYWLTRWETSAHPRRFWGNLIGPALYTLVESLVEGPHFFSYSHHLAYWIFAFAIGSLQSLKLRLPSNFSNLIIVLENVTRTVIVFFMYFLFETHANPTQTSSLNAFFSDSSHQFIGLSMLFLGLIIGLANLTANYYLGLLKQTSAQLKTYSEWLLGRRLLEQAFSNPSTLSLTRRERAVLFMDIRGFTRWSEARSPETVVNLLNNYYQVAESILTRHNATKFKFSADEVIAVFPTAESALPAVLELRASVHQLLSGYHLGAGIGLHIGPLVEGLLGGVDIKFYDVIGDTVNTAKRIESAAHPGEVLISESIRNIIGQTLPIGIKREITVKGKESPLTVYPLEDLGVS